LFCYFLLSSFLVPFVVLMGKSRLLMISLPFCFQKFVVRQISKNYWVGGEQ